MSFNPTYDSYINTLYACTIATEQPAGTTYSSSRPPQSWSVPVIAEEPTIIAPASYDGNVTYIESQFAWPSVWNEANVPPAGTEPTLAPAPIPCNMLGPTQVIVLKSPPARALESYEIVEGDENPLDNDPLIWVRDTAKQAATVGAQTAANAAGALLKAAGTVHAAVDALFVAAGQ